MTGGARTARPGGDRLGTAGGTAHRGIPRGRRAVPRTRREDRGQAAVEYLGFLPILLAVGLAVVQLGLAAYAVQQAGTAARAAARADGFHRSGLDPRAAGEAAVSSWLDTRIRSTGSGPHEVTWTAEIEIPSIVPGVGFGTATKTATMPTD